MSFFINVLKGIIIGIGFIIPGVSGGALAVILGIYDKIFFSIKSIKVKSSFFFLLSILIGIIIGVVGFGNILLILLKTKEIPTKYIFMGLVIGGVPSLLKSIKDQSNEKIKIVPFLLAVFLSFLLYILEQNNLGINIGQELLEGKIPIIGLLFAGFLYATGKIVPGISGSALLMLIGMYEYFLGIIANPFQINIQTILSIIPFSFGVIIGIVSLFYILNILFKKCFITTYSAIVGFVLGSLLYLYPGFSFNTSGLMSIILFFSSSVLTYLLTK